MRHATHHRLRLGRRSIARHVYLCTTVTHGRVRYFEDLFLARIVMRAFAHYDATGTTRTLAAVVMPDHFHWLVQLTGTTTLQGLMKGVKSFTANSINRRLGRDGPVWQAGFHDHGVRRDESLARIARYVIGNPLRAGLVVDLGDYPHWHADWDLI